MARILLIEDDVFFQKFYSSKLTEAGYEMIIASDGEEGLEKMKTVDPQLVLLDIILPKKDGMEILEIRAKDPLLLKIPVIVFSTLGQDKDVIRAKNLGAADYVNKSFFDFENLKTKINTFMLK